MVELTPRSSAIRACCDERGLALSRIVHDVDPDGRDVRPSLVWALEQLAEGLVDVLVLTRLHDLSANPANLRPLLTWFNHEHRTLIALDQHVDSRPRRASSSPSRARGCATVGGPRWPTSPSCMTGSRTCANAG